MTNQYYFQAWCEPNFRAVNRFYRSQKHKGSASGDEQVFVTYLKANEPDTEDTLVAAVRLVPHQGYYWLRSLYVDKTLRAQKLGSQLLTFVHSFLSEHDAKPLPIYCFPYTHLNGFYSQNGYTLLAPEALPESLNQLFTRYSGKGESIISMVKTV